MEAEYRRSVTKDPRFPLRIMLVIGFLVCLWWAAAVADEGAEEAIPAEYAGKIMPTGMRDDPKARLVGKEIYEGRANPEVNCARCHGGDGKPTRLGKGATDLSDPAASKKHLDDYWLWRVSEKKAGTTMPGYRDKLTEEQRWQVIAYLRALAEKRK
jgi:mono/diheme cytochrome c family protein